MEVKVVCPTVIDCGVCGRQQKKGTCCQTDKESLNDYGGKDSLDVLYLLCPHCSTSLIQCLHCDYTLQNKSKHSRKNFKNRHTIEVHQHSSSPDNEATANKNFLTLDDDVEATFETSNDDYEDVDKHINFTSTVVDEKGSNVYGCSTVMSHHYSDLPDKEMLVDLDTFIQQLVADAANKATGVVVNVNDEDDEKNGPEEIICDNPLTNATNEVRANIESQFKGNEISRTYFTQQYSYPHRWFAGLRGIVWRSVNQSSLDDKYADKRTTTMMMRLLLLLLSIPTSLRSVLMMYTLGLYTFLSSFIPRGVSVPRFPISADDMRSMCLENKFAMWNQLPHEKIIEVKDENGECKHAMISIDECIDHMMAHGGKNAKLAFMQNHLGKVDKTGVNGCPAAQRLLEKLRKIVEDNGGDPDKTAFGYVILWSDGFVNSWVKQKNNSVWVMTVTICPPEGSDRSKLHTHCIAMGPGHADHDSVIEHFFKEMQEIRKGKLRHYTDENGKRHLINTSFDILVYMADRPERNHVTKTLAHAGLTSKRVRYAARLDTNKVPSCEKCFDSMIHQVFGVDGIEHSRQRNTCKSAAPGTTMTQTGRPGENSQCPTKTTLLA